MSENNSNSEKSNDQNTNNENSDIKSENNQSCDKPSFISTIKQQTAIRSKDGILDNDK